MRSFEKMFTGIFVVYFICVICKPLIKDISLFKNSTKRGSTTIAESQLIETHASWIFTSIDNKETSSKKNNKNLKNKSLFKSHLCMYVYVHAFIPISIVTNLQNK